MRYRQFLFAALGAVSAHAAPLVSFDANIQALTSASAPTQVAADIVDPALQSGVTLVNVGLTPQNFVGRFGASNFTLSGGEAAALDAGRYLTFTLSPPEGGSFDFTGYSLSLVTQSALRGPHYLGVYTSKGGFTAGSAVQTITLEQTSTPQAEVTVDLSSIGIITEPLEIRFYGYEAGVTGGALSINRLSIVPATVPEPSTTVSLFLGSVFFGTLYFYRRNSLRKGA